MKKMVLENEQMSVFSYWAIIILVILTLLSGGFGVYNKISMQGASSTAIGKQAKFERSQATATIKNYYTDRKKSVLIAQIGIEENPVTPLPFQARDYYLTQSENKELGAFFGRYGTDGDLYVIIPNPEQGKTYEISISNKEFLGVTTSNPTNADLQELSGSVTNQLSNISTMGDKDKKVDNAKKSLTDTILFQMTISPKLKGKEYKVKTIETKNDSLLLRSKSGKVKFDFKTYWNEVYRLPKVKKAEAKIAESVARVAELNDLLTKAEERYKRNPDDENAKQQIDNTNSLIADEETNQQILSDKLVSYKNLKFNPADFGDYTTKIYGRGE